MMLILGRKVLAGGFKRMALPRKSQDEGGKIHSTVPMTVSGHLEREVGAQEGTQD